MVYVDWKRLLAVTPERMTEDEKEELYDTLAWYTPEHNIDKKNILHLVRIIQEMLKYKAELVDSLMNELDDLAGKQGEEEATRRQSLLDEITDLKEQLKYQERRGLDVGIDMTHEEMRNEIIKLEMQNEELLLDLQEREKDLVREKAETESYASQVATLQREKLELTRELAALQEEVTERVNAKSYRDSPEFGPEKLEEMTTSIRQKNKHISQLLEDIDSVEQENESLRSKLSDIKDELSQATIHMTDMTAQVANLKHQLQDSVDKYNTAQQKNSGLQSQIEDLVKEKVHQEKEIDDFAEQLNSKLDEWKVILDAKDAEIEKLKDDLKRDRNTSNFTASNECIEPNITNKLLKRDEQISALQQELINATKELNESAEVIEKLKERQTTGTKFSAGETTEAQLRILQDKVTHLEDKLKYAEEDAHAKAEELSELVIQVKELESGEYGLSEAQSKIKKLEKTVNSKNLQIEKIVENYNQLEIESDNCADENMVLREKLGMSGDDMVDTSQVKMKSSRNIEAINNLKIQLEKKEEDILKVRLKNRKLMKIMKKLSLSADVDSISVAGSDQKIKPVGKVTGEENVCSALDEQKMDQIVRENDALRKGMHEILESIHQQDGSALVEVQSLSLERLLEALDSRHISGWYHPAMRLQSQLNYTEGKMEELRNQIRSLRLANTDRGNELQICGNKIQELEHIIVLQQSELEQRPTSNISGTQDGENLNEKLEVGRNIQQEQKMIELEIEVQHTKLLYEKKKMALEELEALVDREKKDILGDVSSLKLKTRELQAALQGTGFQNSVEDVENKVALDSLKRKVELLEQVEKDLWFRCGRLSSEVINVTTHKTSEIIQLQKDKAQLLTNLNKLEIYLLNSVSREKYDSLAQELVKVESKYHEAVNTSLTVYDDSTVEQLQKEISLCEVQKQKVLDELRTVKEKLYAAEAMMNSLGGNVVTQDAMSNELHLLSAKLATSEVREMNEKHKSVHLEKMNLIMKTEQQELEIHNKELMKCVTDLTQLNSRLQERERELVSEMDKEASSEDHKDLLDHCREVETRLAEVQQEKDNVEELLDISQEQCRAWQLQVEANKLTSSSVKEQMLVLQTSSDDKAALGRLSHELLTLQLAISELTKKNVDAESKAAKLSAEKLQMESNLDQRLLELADTKNKCKAQVEFLRGVILGLRRLYSGITAFPFIENLYNLKLQLRQDQEQVGNIRKDLKRKIEEFVVKKEEMEVQLDSLSELKTALQADDKSKSLIAWHNKVTELKLKGTRCRRQKEFLAMEVTQLEQCVKKLNEEILTLEETIFYKSGGLEQRLLVWEEGDDKSKTARKAADEDSKEEARRWMDDNIRLRGIIEDQREVARKLESRIEKLEGDNSNLSRVVGEKDLLIRTRFDTSGLKVTELEEVVTRDTGGGDSAETMALKATIESLQKVISQKEETIMKYEDLLREGRHEYKQSSGKLQEELRRMHDTLDSQSKAYNKLRQGTQGLVKAESMGKDIEKYLSKVYELEDELTEAQGVTLELKSQAHKAAQEAERWKAVADDRLTLMEEMRQRLEIQFKQEMDTYKEEIQHYQLEVERLKEDRKVVGRDVSNQKLMESLNQMQQKVLESKSSGDEKCAIYQKESESLRKLLKSAKEETSRLRDQVQLLQAQKTKRPGSTSTQDSRLSTKEENLVTKIKTLEELLRIANERQAEGAENELKKLKSAEEVARWDERKRWQQAADRTATKLRDKTVEVEVLQAKNDSLRNLVVKGDKERHILEAQLKSEKGSGRLEKLMAEKTLLIEELARLKEHLEEQKRHSGGVAAALLHDKLQTQERKLAVLELSKQGHSHVTEELERLKTSNTLLEKENLKLETENLSIQLKLEKTRAELKQAGGRARQLHLLADVQGLNVELNEEPEQTMSGTGRNRAPKLLTSTERLRRDLNKAREELKDVQARYLTAVEKVGLLEDELSKCRYQIRLLEEKDLAERITKTNNLELASEMSQELIQVKAQLAHKSHLLDRVKVLLKKAAAKERTLSDQVLALQNLAPSHY